MKKTTTPKKAPTPKQIISLDEISNLGIANFSIKSNEDLETATETLTKLNSYLKAIVEYKEKKTKPLNEALKVIRAETKPYEEQLETLIASIRLKMSQYQTALIQEQKKQELLAIASLEANTITLEEAVTSITPVSEKIETKSGQITFRDKPQLKITNRSSIPDDYWVVDEAKLFSDLKKGLKVPGAEVEIIKIPFNYTK